MLLLCAGELVVGVVVSESGCLVIDSRFTKTKVIDIQAAQRDLVSFATCVFRITEPQPAECLQDGQIVPELFLVVGGMFEKLAKDLTSGNVMGLEDMIAIHVGVEHKSKIMNQELVSKYEIQNEIFQEKLPVIFLFARQKGADDADKLNHYKFEADAGDFSEEAILAFIRQKTAVYFPLPGCIDDFDFLVINFLAESTKFKKEKVMAEAKAKILQIPANDSARKVNAELYITLMTEKLNSEESDASWVWRNLDESRKDATNATLSEVARKEARQRNNVLQSFRLASFFKMVKAPEKDEL